jgi:hypothetical protein
MAFNRQGIPTLDWMRVGRYRQLHWCVIVMLNTWRYGIWPEKSGLSLVHVARDGEIYLSEDKTKRDASKGGAQGGTSVQV